MLRSKRSRIVSTFSPMPLGQRREPFDHPAWFFELKYDGFRALAYVEGGGTKLVLAA
jgi:ATP-dependent DNA ligase